MVKTMGYGRVYATCHLNQDNPLTADTNEIDAWIPTKKKKAHHSVTLVGFGGERGIPPRGAFGRTPGTVKFNGFSQGMPLAQDRRIRPLCRQ